MNLLQTLAQSVRNSKGIAHKKDIALGMHTLATQLHTDSAVLVGDDCAAIPNGDSYLLFAIEGFMNEFVQADPWFAGYCGVMVNLSDIAAMGGRATAVVDAVWSQDAAQLQQILQGMAAASNKYCVPIVGGHTNARTDRNQLAVSILGSATTLLSSFSARPGDVLMSVIDLRGSYRGGGNNWNASTEAPAERLRGDLELLPEVANLGLSVACKDISMAGPLGTLLMMLECSACGADIWPDSFPRPEGVSIEQWMQTFPSFGFVFSASTTQVQAMRQLFANRDLMCAQVGHVVAGEKVWLNHGTERALLWDFSTMDLLACNQLNQSHNARGEEHASG